MGARAARARMGGHSCAIASLSTHRACRLRILCACLSSSHRCWQKAKGLGGGGEDADGDGGGGDNDGGCGGGNDGDDGDDGHDDGDDDGDGEYDDGCDGVATLCKLHASLVWFVWFVWVVWCAWCVWCVSIIECATAHASEKGTADNRTRGMLPRKHANTHARKPSARLRQK